MSRTELRGRPHHAAHEALKVLDTQMRIECMSRNTLAKISGIPARTLADWWYGKSDPTVSKLEACLNVFGMRLKTGGGVVKAAGKQTAKKNAQGSGEEVRGQVVEDTRGSFSGGGYSGLNRVRQRPVHIDRSQNENGKDEPDTR